MIKDTDINWIEGNIVEFENTLDKAIDIKYSTFDIVLSFREITIHPDTVKTLNDITIKGTFSFSSE